MAKIIKYFEKYLSKIENVKYLDRIDAIYNLNDKSDYLDVTFKKNIDTKGSHLTIPIGNMLNKDEDPINKIYAKTWAKQISNYLKDHENIYLNDEIEIIKKKVAKKFAKKLSKIAIEKEYTPESLKKFFKKHEYGYIDYKYFKKIYEKELEKSFENNDIDYDK